MQSSKKNNMAKTGVFAKSSFQGRERSILLGEMVPSSSKNIRQFIRYNATVRLVVVLLFRVTFHLPFGYRHGFRLELVEHEILVLLGCRHLLQDLLVYAEVFRQERGQVVAHINPGFIHF